MSSAASTVFAGLLTVGNLFAPKPAPKLYVVDWSVKVPAVAAPTGKPVVVCGMTLVPADPKVDPKMRVNAPDGGVAFTMRAIQPTVCQK
jgi:hypothetical protein